MVCKGTEYEMPQSSHEEADTRTIIHMQDFVQRGTNTIMICTVDMDIIVFLIGHFYALREQNPNADVWVSFGTGKHFCYYHIKLSVQILVLERVGHFHLFMHLLDVMQHPLSFAKVKCQLSWLGNPIRKQ